MGFATRLATLARMDRDTLAATDVLVLGGGGVLGEAWMSAVLAGIERAGTMDPRGCSGFLGTSAGAIVAASLAAGLEPGARLGPLGPVPVEPAAVAAAPSALSHAFSTAGGAGQDAIAPIVSLTLGWSTFGGALVRRAALRRVPRGRQSLARLGEAVAQTGVRWDGRLRVSAVALDSGRRVVFGAGEHGAATVADAVQASCSIPGVFEPHCIDGRLYVDGGVWSPTNIDAAGARRGQRVLCLNPTGALRAPVGSFARTISAVSRSAAQVEALALRHRGVRVCTVAPDRRCAAALGTNLMDPRGRDAVIEAGLRQGAELAVSVSYA
ncbi:MAG TPA: patatin-like phospholipase family protein [Solirubrobacteraceae bacterium]|jgi:NTE family protein|nr:patatin-like phospholipase family protein [Solirubrobacteraceae bacterium]